MSYTNILNYLRKRFRRILIAAVIAGCFAVLFFRTQTGDVAAQPTFYPRSQYSQQYSQQYSPQQYSPQQSFVPPWQSSSPEVSLPPLPYLPQQQQQQQQQQGYSGYGAGYSTGYNTGYGNELNGFGSGSFGGNNFGDNSFGGNSFGGNSFGGWSDITSLLGFGFRMPASGLELLVVIAMYGFRYISLVQKRLKDGDDTLLTRIDANEMRQNGELEKILNALDIFRRETYDAHRDLNQKMDGVLGDLGRLGRLAS
jgi:hypothetical protein